MTEAPSTGSFLSNKRFHSLLGLGVSAALIAWIVLSVNLSEVADEITRLRYWAIIPALLAFLAHFALRALRWRYLLPPRDQPPSLLKLYDAIMLGNFATYILPLRAGEFVRPYLLTKQSDYSFSSTFVSVVIERFFDLACVLLSFGAVLLYIEGIPDWVVKGAFILSGLALGIFFFILVGSLLPKLVISLCETVFSVLPEKVRRPAIKFISDFLAGAEVLSRGGNLLIVLLLSVLVWATSYGIFYVYFFMFDMQPSIALAITGGVIVALAVAAPSAPGFVGVYQTGCIAAFQLFSYDRELAVAYSLITHLFQYIVFILYAWLFFARSGLSFSAIATGREADPLVSKPPL